MSASGVILRPKFEVPEGVEVWGTRDRLTLPTNYIISLAQTRCSSNPVQAELTESIAAKGLIHSPTISLLGGHAFAQYLQFTQESFGEVRQFTDFTGRDLGSDEPVYPIILDGHSRQLSLLELARRNNEPLYVDYSIDPAASPQDIVLFQLAANILARPSKDQEAVSNASAFKLARYLDPTLTKTAFAREHGLSAAHLTNALHFVDLPAKIMRYVQEGGMPFTLGAELGKYAPLFKAYHDYYPAKDGTDLEESLILELSLHASRYYKLKSVKKAIIWMRGAAARMQQDLLEDPSLDRDKYPGVFSSSAVVATGNIRLFQEPPSRVALLRKELAQFRAEVDSVRNTRAQRLASLVFEINNMEDETSDELGRLRAV